MTHATLPSDLELLGVRLTHWEGQAVGLDWAGLSTRDRADMAQVLTELGLTPTSFMQLELARCYFWRSSHTNMAGLGFEHHCPTLRCSHNGVQLPPGQGVWLEADDVLEIGLCRCEIQRTGAVATAAHSTSDGTAPGLPEIDLRTLASDQPNAIDRPPDALLDLLGQALEPPASKARPHDLFNEAPGEPTLAQAPDARPTAATDEEPLSALSQWHEKYLQRLRSPFEQPQDLAWVDLMQQGQQASADPFDALMGKVGKDSTLDELLGQSAHIRTVLVQLDTTAEHSILDPDSPENLLHLFAPPQWRAQDAKQTLPLLSRQEHHGVALDSALSPATQDAHAPKPKSQP